MRSSFWVSQCAAGLVGTVQASAINTRLSRIRPHMHVCFPVYIHNYFLCSHTKQKHYALMYTEDEVYLEQCTTLDDSRNVNGHDFFLYILEHTVMHAKEILSWKYFKSGYDTTITNNIPQREAKVSRNSPPLYTVLFHFNILPYVSFPASS